jgi:hypothetical protein
VHPEWNIRSADGGIWRSKTGAAWVNPYKREAWDYNIGIAEELVKLGFGEIQFDYIRFPEPYKSLGPQVFPESKGVSKPENLAAFLKEAKTRLNALGVRSTADIFGLVTSVKGPLEIGQWWEKLAPVTDVLLPMTYPSHYPPGSFGIPRPNAEPYKVIRTAIDTARVRNERLGITAEEHVRPWIQAFTLGKPPYGPEEIRQQKQAIYGFCGAPDRSSTRSYPRSRKSSFPERRRTDRRAEGGGRMAPDLLRLRKALLRLRDGDDLERDREFDL